MPDKGPFFLSFFFFFTGNFVRLRDSHESLSRTMIRAESVPNVQNKKAEDNQKSQSVSAIQSDESKKEQIRLKVIEEIYTTEVAYKNDLMVMNNVKTSSFFFFLLFPLNAIVNLVVIGMIAGLLHAFRRQENENYQREGF